MHAQPTPLSLAVRELLCGLGVPDATCDPMGARLTQGRICFYPR
jgi:hypothetical protein